MEGCVFVRELTSADRSVGDERTWERSVFLEI